MGNIILKADRKYPSRPTITGSIDSHTTALQAMAEAIDTHERRTKDVESSFVRVRDLVDLGFCTLESGVLIPVDFATDTGGGGGGGGEANTASNIGSGAHVFDAKVGVDLRFKTLVEGTNVTITEGVDEIVIDAAGGAGEANTASNLGSGSGVFASKSGVDLQFKSLVAGSNVTLTPTGTEIAISAATGSGEANTASNLGSGSGVFASKSGVDLQFKSLTAGTGITLTPSGTEVAIAATGGNGFSGALVTRATVQAISNSTVTQVIWDTETFNTDLYHSNITNPTRLTARSAGYYVVGFNIDWTNAGSSGNRIAWLVKNGTTQLPCNLTISGGQLRYNGNTIVFLNAGEYIEVNVFQSSGGPLNIAVVDSASAFWMYRAGGYAVGGPTFTGLVSEDGTSLTNFTSVSGTWTIGTSGLITLNTGGGNFGRIRHNVAGPYLTSKIELEIFLSASISSTSVSVAGLIFGWDGATAGSRVVRLQWSSGDPATTGQIQVDQDGTGAVKTYTQLFSKGAWHKLKILKVGLDLTIYFDDAYVGSVTWANTSTHNAIDYVGLIGYAQAANEVLYRNFRVVSLTNVEPGSGSGTTPIPVSIDAYPSAPNAADDEFEYGTVIDTTGARRAGATAWAWRGQGSATATVANGALTYMTNGTTTSLIEQPTSGTTWKYRARIGGATTTSGQSFGFFVAAASTGKTIRFCRVQKSTANYNPYGLLVQRINSFTTFVKIGRAHV